MANYNERQLNNGEQGEGSGLNADKVDNSEGSELGNTIDGSSITENAQGEIQATQRIYKADFENSKNGWIFGEDTSRSTAASQSGSFCAEIYIKNGKDGIKREFNLDNVSTVIFSYRNTTETKNSGFDRASGEYIVRVGSDEAFNSGNIDQDTWATAEVDVSSYSGTKKIHIEVKNSSSLYWEYYLDDIEVKTAHPVKEVITS